MTPGRPIRGPVLARAAGTAGVGVLLLLAGCAGTDAPNVTVVSITPTGFEPASITVPAGTEVRFVNQVAARASVTSLELADPTDTETATVGSSFDSGPLGQGEAFALQVEGPAELLYHSTFHTDLNWVGAIRVEGP